MSELTNGADPTNGIDFSDESTNQEPPTKPPSPNRIDGQISQGQPTHLNSDITEDHILPRRLRGRREINWVGSEITQTEAIFHSSILESTSFKEPRLHQKDLPRPPKGWKELSKHPHSEGFTAAARKEYNTLTEKDTFQIIDRSMAQPIRPLPTMWVFTYKFDADGFLIKYKARLVVRGDMQTEEDETYAATLAARVFRSL
ncbi:hypothetical protein B7494_g4882 [Chlorociboria aeruginascens]|nr:hypothetical protein B7494_g4882 [Chlorociboria aeruginascens]